MRATQTGDKSQTSLAISIASEVNCQCCKFAAARRVVGRNCLQIMRSLVIAIVSLGTLAFAQAGYEGQPVSSIELIANPHLDASHFQPLIVQKSGQAYSENDVKTSVENLKNEGGFSQVEVNVTPEAAGVNLTFVLERA
jgi:outer membrane protein assembly factor BamA